MKSSNFLVTCRPQLAKLTEHAKMDFADYERRLASLQELLQLIQQAYLGTSERGLLVLEGWDTAGKGGVVRRLGWALDPRSFKVHQVRAPDEHGRAQHCLQRFWLGSNRRCTNDRRRSACSASTAARRTLTLPYAPQARSPTSRR